MLRVCSAMLAFVAVTLMGPSATAQGVIKVPDGLLVAGETIEIHYSNPTRANETITIRIDDAGFPSPRIVEIEVPLDANGEGSTNWKVPEWPVAEFNAPDADQKTRFIKLQTPPPNGAPEPADGALRS